MSLREAEPAHAPDLIEPVVGFRQWRLRDDRLLSLAVDELWGESTLVARCRAGGHRRESPPVTGCSCGVYAWYEPCPRMASAATSDYVAGAVVLWGAIELHVTGMRAQYCRIVALALPLSRWGKRDRVLGMARDLDVPAVPHRELRAIARRQGAPVPDELRPPREWLSGTGPVGVVPRMVASAAGMAAGTPAPRLSGERRTDPRRPMTDKEEST